MYRFVVVLFLCFASCTGRLMEDVEQSIEYYMNAVMDKVHTDIINGNQSYFVNREGTDDFPDFAKYSIWCHNGIVQGLENGTIINVTSTDVTDSYYNFSIAIQYNVIEFIADINITSLTNSTRYDGYGTWGTRDFTRYVHVLITKNNEGKLTAHGVDGALFPNRYFWVGVHIPDAPLSITDWGNTVWGAEVGFYTIHRLNTWMAELFMKTVPNIDPTPYFSNVLFH